MSSCCYLSAAAHVSGSAGGVQSETEGKEGHDGSGQEIPQRSSERVCFYGSAHPVDGAGSIMFWGCLPVCAYIRMCKHSGRGTLLLACCRLLFFKRKFSEITYGRQESFY